MSRHIALPLLLFLGSALSAKADVQFSRDIRPILSNKCFQCHGPDEAERKGHLRLDIAGGDEGAYRIHKDSQAIKPGDLEASELWYRITTDDPDEVMPPPDAHGKALTAKDRELLKQWILGGAEYQDFWAFVPPRGSEIPETKDTKWSAGAIDRYVLARLEAEGLTPSPKADKRTLIRRLNFDLTGLPPTVDEVRAFLADDSPDAYAKLVDRLLERPQYGEHMAKYWLDLVRFADTNGMHHDHYREMTPYRDWVIRSFNDNLRFDDFISYQVAGDLYPEPTTDQLVASGFNRLHLIIDVGTALPEESFAKNVIDRVTAVGTAFMGLTMQCAVCHDHKYDPITQKDFFQIAAFFNNFDGQPETGRRGTPDFKRGLQPPYIPVPSKEQEASLNNLDQQIAALGEGEKSKQVFEKIASLKKQRQQLLAGIPAAMVMKERSEIRPTHILVRGAYDNPGDLVERDTPAFLPPLEDNDGKRDRLDFARWLVAPSNPLTARVAVNRFWQQFFGVGIVKTSEDFGAQGEWPSHPELLDHLALRFVESDWDVKALVRSIVLSETYQQDSAAPRERFVDDPDNRLLARGSRFRLDSEMVRDQVLAATGLLNPALYGKSVKPPQPEGLWKIVTMPSSYPREYKADSGDSIYRRSVYTFWKRGQPPPQMSIFDAPTRDACIARRERTNTPLQALLLMNEEQYFAAARTFAGKLLAEPGLDEGGRLERAYETITSKLPTAATKAKLTGSLAAFRSLYSADTAAAEALAKGAAPPEQRTELAAWTMLVHSLLNLDATKTRE